MLNLEHFSLWCSYESKFVLSYKRLRSSEYFSPLHIHISFSFLCIYLTESFSSPSHYLSLYIFFFLSHSHSLLVVLLSSISHSQAHFHLSSPLKRRWLIGWIVDKVWVWPSPCALFVSEHVLQDKNGLHSSQNTCSYIVITLMHLIFLNTRKNNK